MEARPLIASALVLVVVRGALRAGGLVVLSAVVLATVGLLTIGVGVLRLLLG